MKIAELACPSCGMSRLVRMKERGHKVACGGCDGVIEVPENLDFPDYVDLFEDRVLARDVRHAAYASLVLCCAPAAAVAWWFASGAAQRALEEGRPVDPQLVRAKRVAAIVTVVEVTIHGVAIALSLR